MQVTRLSRRPSAYSGYIDPRIFGAPVTPDRYRSHAQRTWSDKTLYYDRTIINLNAALEAALDSFGLLRHAFEEETKLIRWYARDEILDSLWAARMDTKASERPIPGPEEEAKKSRAKLERALGAAMFRTRNVVSQRNRNALAAKDQANIDRTLSKIETFGKQCLELLALSDRQYTQFVPLIREIGFLKSVIHEHDFEGSGEDGDNWSD